MRGDYGIQVWMERCVGSVGASGCKSDIVDINYGVGSYDYWRSA